jgi:hypothetical protein
MDLVKVRNTHPSKPLVLRHDGQGHITIKPRGERIVPLEYATLSFGNPGTRNEGRNRLRAAEYKQARTLWGFYPGLMSEDEWVDEIGPKFEVYDLEGERVYMVLDDPEGIHASSSANATTSERTDSQFVSDRIGALEAQIAQLTRVLAAQQPDTVLPVPGPTSPPTPTSPGDDPFAALADAANADAAATVQTQEARNEQRDEIPKPANKPVAKDGPKATRVGGR